MLARKGGQNIRKAGKDATRPCVVVFAHATESPMNAARYLPFIGRLFIGLPFMMSGASKLAAYGATAALIASSKLPLPVPLAYAGAVAVEIGCGLLVVAGYRTRIVAGVLALFCLATAVFFHTDFGDPNQIFHFIKNLVMTGGLLLLVAHGPGLLSVDNRNSRSS
jgi:putative oxidoreductase